MKKLIAVVVFALFGSACLAQVYSISPGSNGQANVAGPAAGTMYASTCPVTVNSSTPTSTFCPVATDSTSVTKRTYPANTLTPGRAFYAWGGGTYTVPTGNLLAADVNIKVGSATVMSITTPAAPVGTNQGVIFFATCTVQLNGTSINCMGKFEFVVAGATGAPIAFSQTNTFTPGVANVIDVTGDWNGTTTTQATVVSEAVLMALN